MAHQQRKTGKSAGTGKQPSVKSEDVQDHGNGFAGELINIRLDNLIQLYCISAETIALKIRQGDIGGTVYLENGEIIHAESGTQTGEEAFYIIAALQGGRIETSQTEKAEQRTIHNNYQYLLMEAARLSDENDRLGEDEEPEVINTESREDAIVVEEKKLKALVVDDSKFMRKIIANMLTAEGDIEVVGTAGDGREALQQLTLLQPDFVTLDANMPVMDGPTALKHIMIKKPCPVIVMSNLVSGDQDALTHFFNLGAVDFLPKPVKNKNMFVQQQQILSRARSAARARILNFKRYPSAETPATRNDTAEESSHKSLVVFISGLGGYHEMLHVLSNLSGGPNTYFAVFQGLPEEFTESFSISAGRMARLNTVAVDSKRILQPRCCYIASLESHILFQLNDDGYSMVSNGTACSRTGKLKNIGDFIDSAVENFAGSVHMVFLSGAEGIPADSLDAIRGNRGRIIVQDPSSCMMPHFLEELISRGIVDTIASPENIVRELLMIV